MINSYLGVKQNMGKRSERGKNSEKSTVLVGKEEGLKSEETRRGKDKGG